jgi:hypothetical protein
MQIAIQLISCTVSRLPENNNRTGFVQPTQLWKESDSCGKDPPRRMKTGPGFTHVKQHRSLNNDERCLLVTASSH